MFSRNQAICKCNHKIKLSIRPISCKLITRFLEPMQDSREKEPNGQRFSFHNNFCKCAYIELDLDSRHVSGLRTYGYD